MTHSHLHEHAGGDPLDGAGLPGEATSENPNFIMRGVLDSLPLGILLEMAAMAGRPGEGRPGAADVTLFPTAGVTYPDGARAGAVGILLSESSILGIWQGRAPATNPLVAADWLLPYFLAETGRRSAHQRTSFRVYAGAPGGAIFQPAWRLTSQMFQWTQLADEVEDDAREGQPNHPLYGSLRSPPIVTYRGMTDPASLVEPSEAQETPDELETEFARRVAALLEGGQAFYGHQAGATAGVSNALARFYLRRMAKRGQLATVESASPRGSR